MNIPPIKIQGIKTKLIPTIKEFIPQDFKGIWIEPFMGSGSVVFNILPDKAILSDNNPHIINFYNNINNGKINSKEVKDFLLLEGQKLKESDNCSYFYEVRDRFNKDKNSLDFLFINRSCFNGLIRFNKKGEFNSPSDITKSDPFNSKTIDKICNQVDNVYNILKDRDYHFICQSFEKTINIGKQIDLIYCDPPYIGRNTQYYTNWKEDEEYKLYDVLKKTESRFILSNWYKDSFRENKYINSLWNSFNLYTKSHRYNISSNPENRKNEITEVIITNY